MRASRVVGAVAGALAALMVATAHPGAAQTGPGPDEALSTVQGRVVDARTGEPIAGARMSLLLNGGVEVPLGPVAGRRFPQVFHVATDDEGRFTFEQVWPPAQWLVGAEAPGYVPARFGQPSGGELGVSFRVAAGETVSNVDLELVRAGVINGRVFGDAGEGLPGVEMSLLREEYRPGGVTPVPIAWAQTEAEGMFRFEDVEPGEYLVRAEAPDSLTPEDAGAYTATFFGNVTDPILAARVFVGPGQEVFGSDLSLETIELLDLHGQLVDPAGGSFDGVGIQVLNFVTGEDPNQRPDAVDAEGRFTLTGLRPGSYTLAVRGDMALSDERRWPTTDVRLDEATGEVVIAAEPPALVSGRFLLADRTAPPFDAGALGLTFTLRPANVTMFFGGGGGAGADGTFEMSVDSGEMLVGVRDLPAGWAVAEIRADGRVLRGDTVEVFPGGRPVIEVELTDRLGAVSGTVTDEDDEPVSRAAVLLFPAERDRWVPGRLILKAFAQPDGSYRFDDVLPGDYELVALAELPANAERDEAVLAQLYPRATQVRVLAGEPRIEPLELVPQPPVLTVP